MAAEVASTAAGGTVVVPQPKSPFAFTSPSTTNSVPRRPSVSSPQHYQTQTQALSSPGDESNRESGFFSHHHQQRLSPSNHIERLPASSAVPRGLTAMVAAKSPPRALGGSLQNDPRLPMSPGSIALALGNENADGLAGDPTAPRKRSKVSRACDECRRKKVSWVFRKNT